VAVLVILFFPDEIPEKDATFINPVIQQGCSLSIAVLCQFYYAPAVGSLSVSTSNTEKKTEQ
jgi:hypothetical protein